MNEEKSVGSRRLFINNLAWQVSWQDLKDHFNTVGTVVYADVKKNFDGRSKGWGVVEYETAEDAAKAMAEMNQSEMAGRTIFVREDREDFETNRNTSGSKRPFREQRRFNSGGGFVHGGNQFHSGGGGGQGGHRVYVSNLHPSVRWQDLKDVFRAAGDIVRADVFPSSNVGRSYGIIQYSSAEDAQKCIQTMDRSMLKGQPVFVREDREVGQQDGSYEGQDSQMQQGGNGGSGTQVVVFGIPYSYNNQELRDLFTQMSPISADVVVSGTGASKGYGTVNFGSPEDAAAAIQAWDQQQLEGRSLTVRMDKFGM
mmetsp:Transcript_9760/g.18609  ORF Transcript_9760/g.18609 Transcript_9760/m.18609 type:complete len:312 (-) Transcript_9760:47-982(-)